MKILLVAAFFLIPLVTMAQTYYAYDIISFIQILVDIINRALIPLLLAIAVLVFFWGVFRYFIFEGGEEDKASAKRLIVWGILGFFVIVTLWGLVAVLVNTFGLTNTPPVLPLVPGT